MNSVERCINDVELFYSTHLTTGIAGTSEAESFTLSLVQLLHCPFVLISPLKLQLEVMKCQIAKIAEGGISSPYSFPGTANLCPRFATIHVN
ncbi:hypothetical protein [Nostoc sp. CALU 546]|uniref:hypothetical protein n=1 Tax=Nostoc sp. CALU 546 TaxID=1867241 RepID=UPI003B6812A6